MTDSQLIRSERAYWYRAGEVLKLKERSQLRQFRASTPHKDDETFENNLDTLWYVVHEQQAITYFEETRQELDEVLQIFVRLNVGGTPLSYSDLLLSLATASWKTDAREQVYGLVEELNRRCGQAFAFSKDFVLKTLLVLSDRDIRFRAENIRRKNQLEDIWDKVAVALRVTVRLLAQFGLNDHTLTAPTAAIPIAYYVYKTGQEERFLTANQHEGDREAIRDWLFKVQLGKVFRGQTDQLLV